MADAPVETTRKVVPATFYWREIEDKPNEYELKVDPITTARAGDKIEWAFTGPTDPSDPDSATGVHTLSIWFPATGVFYTPLLTVMHPGKSEATIREDVWENPDEKAVRVDEHGARWLVVEYCIYDHTARRFVVCSSHPKIEIPWP